ncbi:MAG: hypothetical protein M3461_23695 [Pseudomonadota bacterium]|nr:hypothetical protein [Pseudomonadota bacterium]
MPATTIRYSVSFFNATGVGLSRQDGPGAVLTAGDGFRRIRLARGSGGNEHANGGEVTDMVMRARRPAPVVEVAATEHRGIGAAGLRMGAGAGGPSPIRIPPRRPLVEVSDGL